MFTQICDKIVQRTGRAPNILDIEDNVNATVRELTMYENRFFERDLEIAEFMVDTLPFTFTLPANCRKISEVVAYRAGSSRGEAVAAVEFGAGMYASAVVPNYYQAGDVFVCNNLRGYARLAVSYYIYRPRLLYRGTYYDYVNVPRNPVIEATYSWDTMSWTYGPSLSTPELQAAARILCGNWVLERYPDLVELGARTKLYIDVPDGERNRNLYALYTKRQAEILGEKSTLKA